MFVDSCDSAIHEGGGGISAVHAVMEVLLVVQDPGSGPIVRYVVVSCVVNIVWFCSSGTTEVGAGVPGSGGS